MNKNILIIIATFNAVILLSSLGIYYKLSSPAVDGAMILSMDYKQLPLKEFMEEYGEYTKEEKRETFERLLKVYNGQSFYITSQGLITNSIIKHLSVYAYVLFAVSILNLAVLVYLIFTHRHNYPIKRTE